MRDWSERTFYRLVCPIRARPELRIGEAVFSVLDLSAIVSGPLTAALLADQGASVIKVERLVGDIQRHVGSSRNGFSGFLSLSWPK